MYQQQLNNGAINMKKMLAIATRQSYQDVYQRAYSLNATPNSLNKLESIFMDNGTQAHNNRLTEAMISHAIPEIIGLNANPIGKAIIPNGWGTQRIRFILEVESVVGGNVMVSYVQGFTEFHDPSLYGKLDPNMVFHINSITNVIRMVDPINGMFKVRPHSTFNVVTDLAGGARYEEIEGPSDLKLIRPRDIIDNISNLDIYGANSDILINNTGSIASKPNTSDRANNDPIKYFTKTANLLIEAKAGSEISYDSSDVLRSASSSAAEFNLMSLPFIYQLHTVTGELPPTKFTLNTLNYLDPHIAQKIDFFDNATDLGGFNHTTILDTAHTSELFQPTIETMTATTVAQSINSMMIDCLLSEFSVSFTNMDGGFEPTVVVSNARSFIEGIDITFYVNKVVSKIRHSLMPEITKGGMLGIEAIVTSDILGDTTVAIGVSQGYTAVQQVVFRFPTFADSLYVPVISTNSYKSTIVEDFSNVFDRTYNFSDANSIYK